MKRPLLVAGNWKMNKNARESIDFMHELLREIEDEEQIYFALFPQNINLLTAKQVLAGTKVAWGAQNCHFEESGAYTGETSARHISEIGATLVLIGHSERREYFGESNQMVAKKLQMAQSWGLTPIVCVGETLDVFEAGNTERFIQNQIEESLDGARFDGSLIIAYEPVWAIGTGKVATPEIAEKVQAIIRQKLKELSNSETAERIQILYGGSVKPDNAKDLYLMPNIDGFLVGGASLQVSSFVNIYYSCRAT